MNKKGSITINGFRLADFDSLTISAKKNTIDLTVTNLLLMKEIMKRFGTVENFEVQIYEDPNEKVKVASFSGKSTKGPVIVFQHGVDGRNDKQELRLSLEGTVSYS